MSVGLALGVPLLFSCAVRCLSCRRDIHKKITDFERGAAEEPAKDSDLKAFAALPFAERTAVPLSRLAGMCAVLLMPAASHFGLHCREVFLRSLDDIARECMAARSNGARDESNPATRLLTPLIGSILKLCVGPTDSLRVVALQTLVHLAGSVQVSNIQADADAVFDSLPLPLAADAAKEIADQFFVGLYDVDRWVGPLSHAGLTARTAFLPLSSRQTQILKRLNQTVSDAFVAAQRKHESQATSKAFGCTVDRWCMLPAVQAQLSDVFGEVTALAAQLTASISACGTRHGGCFVKLSTRSPKDTRLLAMRADAMRAQDGVDRPANGRRDKYDGLAMCVQHGWEALDLLCTSYRVEEDLSNWAASVQRFASTYTASTASVSSSSSSIHLPESMSLVVREWLPMPQWTELRGFVVDNRLTALSQYFLDDGDICPALITHRSSIGDMVRVFFERLIAPELKKLGILHAVVDFALEEANGQGDQGDDTTAGTKRLRLKMDDKQWSPTVVELNPFYSGADCGLFDRGDEHDYAVLIGRQPFEFRVLTEELVRDRRKGCLSFPNATDAGALVPGPKSQHRIKDRFKHVKSTIDVKQLRRSYAAQLRVADTVVL